ncbi:acyl transferase/acyl hydrolase/lysophospholipase [Dactylonectria estremocensis]|uniref:Acyl transferase/acyl hydrolase/lysophospholipase n=1 Tax=Dactylonectria estremocensis TaxID=1079267 RepID=A0A9P9IVE7_9HYPO|nr:acyl transferase/acyl hydrolase/lysophospholipase [Dactylonectria estremocensis]
MSTSSGSDPKPIRRAATNAFQDKAQRAPWEPIVLSLDGGGIKGLSELFILLKITERIKELIVEGLSEGGNIKDDELFAFLRDPILLPCYFFDFMVGTSTGGLIAVMLGRLRMSVPDAIKAYWCLGNDIFWPRPIIGRFSSTKLRQAILRVIEHNCGCHEREEECHDMEPLGQYDYAEVNDIDYHRNPSLQNFTCKVALVAQRKEVGSQNVHLFRSYNFTRRPDRGPTQRNPETIGENHPRVWEACRATSAAPLNFRKMAIGTDKFIDGGAGNNNPCDLAWNEAMLMLTPINQEPDTEPNNRTPAAMVSLGCGEKRKHTLFGNQFSLSYVRKAWLLGKSKITDAEPVHIHMRDRVRENGSDYFRFSVKQTRGDHGNNGLSGIELADCKRESQRPWPGSFTQPQAPVESTGLPEWYTQLQTEASQQEEERRKGGFKPEKYWYTTFDTIFTRTEQYCTDRDVRKEIDKCANLLLTYARERQANDPERWKCLVSHPHPDHPSYLESTRRPNSNNEENGW